MRDDSLRQPQTDQEWHELADLTAKVFAHPPGGYHHFYKMVNHGHRNDPTGITLGLWMDGEVRGHIRLAIRESQWGSVRIPSASLGCVGTDGRYRGTGLGRLLMEGTLAEIARRGIPLSLVYGIPDFYCHFGYGPTHPRYLVKVNPTKLRGVASDWEVTPAKKEDLPQLRRLKEEWDLDLWASLRRPDPYWERLDPSHVLVVREAGQIQGYLVLGQSDGVLLIREVGIASPRAGRSLLPTLYQRAKEEMRTEIRGELPPNHPFARLLYREYEGVLEEFFPPNREGMGQIVLWDAFWEALLPQLQTRALGAPRGEWSARSEKGSLCFKWDGVHLECITGPPSPSALPSHSLLQLALGLLTPEELGLDHPLARALFPKQNPFLWPNDRA